MTITKEQVLRYLDGFQAELEQERVRHADQCREEGFRMLSQFVRGARSSVYASLRSDLERMRELVGVYGPERVERGESVDDASPPAVDDTEAFLAGAGCREDDGTD